MSYCKKCGQEINDEKFCKNCGHNLAAEHETQSDGKSPNTYEFVEKMKEHKKLLGIGGSVLAVLVITILIIGHFNSPDRLVQQFEEAVQDGDAERVAELMAFTGNEEVQTEDAEGFVKYLNENQGDYGDIYSSLQDQLKIMNEGDQMPSNFEEAVEAFSSSGSDSLVTLEKDGTFLFFDQYHLVVEPVYLELGSNVEDTTVSIGDKEVGLIETSDELIEAGPFLPGNHTVAGKVKNAWGEYETEEQLQVFSNGSHRLNFDLQYIDLELPGNMIESDLEEIDMQFYVNGEAVEAEMLEGQQIGPMVQSEDQRLMVEMDFPWGTMQTREYTLDQSSIPMSYELPEEHQDAYIEAINEHLTVYLESLEAGEVLFEDYITEDYRESVQEDIDDLLSGGTSSYARGYQSGVIGDESISVHKVNDQFMVGVPVYTEVQWGRDRGYDAEENLNNIEQENEFMAEFDQEDGWRIITHTSGQNFDFDNGIEFDIDTDLYVFEEPQEDDETEVSSSEESNENESESESEEQESTNEMQVSIEDRTTGYVNDLVEAINAGDYGIVEGHIQSDSSLESDQQALVERLYEDDITQEVLDVTVQDVTEISDGHFQVETEETIEINYPDDGPEEETYNWTYTAEEVDDQFYLNGIE